MHLPLSLAGAALGLGLLIPQDALTEAPPAHRAENPVPVAHCQIPCGIYGDQTRFTILAEHITTIEKSMTKISELEASSDNANQLIRWVINKEEHADALVTILTEYFLQQRIKTSEATSDAARYHAKLAAVHQLMVLAMQAKQTTNQAHIASLRTTLDEFEHLSLGKAKDEDHQH